MAKRPMARDIAETLRDKVSPEVMAVLVGLAEYQNVQRQQIKDLANLANDAVDHINRLVSVIGVFKSHLEKYKEHLPKGVSEEDGRG